MHLRPIYYHHSNRAKVLLEIVYTYTKNKIKKLFIVKIFIRVHSYLEFIEKSNILNRTKLLHLSNPRKTLCIL